jgi:hypothetical protein
MLVSKLSITWLAQKRLAKMAGSASIAASVKNNDQKTNTPNLRLRLLSLTKQEISTQKTAFEGTPPSGVSESVLLRAFLCL